MKNRNIMKRIVYILIALVTALTAAAQLPHSYSCDFEDANENAQWNLNTPKNASYEWLNQWIIGDKVASLGEKSMYITPDEGASVGYAKTQSRIVVAWRELQLEAGRYDLAFDWMCGGDSARAALMVAWVPESQFGDIVCKLNDDYNASKWIKNNMLKFDCQGILAGMPVWTHAVDTLYTDGTPHRLVFMFVYSSSAMLKHPGPCVDNIQLARNNCGEPKDKQVSMASQNVTLSWQSGAESFNLRLHRMGDTEAIEVQDIKQDNYSTSLQEGIYDIQIQVVCEGDTSAWYGFPPAIVHDARCFDYLDLTDERCYYSDTTSSNYLKTDLMFSQITPRKIDYGFASVASRHTIHYIPDEYDARTLNSIDSDSNPVSPLKTIPDGALASVRIGSWEEHARAARVVYDFTVDANEASVLMLQYAMVLQYAKHEEPQRPRMMIDIVDALTNKSLEPCTTVDLASEVGGEGWYRVPYDPNSLDPNAKDVCWRDWTTMGLNLAEHHGKHVKVVITVLGCAMSAHFGYAYFTLSCTSGQIKGMHCGWEPTNEFIAPEGFNYRWYKVSAPNKTVGTDNVLTVDYTDTCTYAVDMTYKSDKNCGFTLYASAVPRFPIPEATYTLEQRDCHNFITLHNTSHIRTYNYWTKEMIDTPIRPEYVGWSFDGLAPQYDPQKAPWEISFQLPDEEADYQFLLLAGVGLCDSILKLDIHVPAVGPDSVVDIVQRCEGDIYYHNGKPYTKDALIKEYDYNTAGCDSLHVTDLRFVAAIYINIEKSIPEGDTVLIGTEAFTQTGVYTVTLKSVAGCDSIVTLDLTVVEPLVVEISSVESPCPEDASFLIETHARKGKPNRYTLQFDEAGEAAGLVTQTDELTGYPDNTIEVPVPEGMISGYYVFKLAFDSEINGTCEVTGEATIHYSSSLIRQRWDDILGILNAEYNGGYDFQYFQWYRNGNPIDGATEPYYYIESKLKAGDTYTVELKQRADDRGLTTCGYVVPAADAAPASAAQRVLRDGQLLINVNGRTYNALGRVVE